MNTAVTSVPDSEVEHCSSQVQRAYVTHAQNTFKNASHKDKLKSNV